MQKPVQTPALQPNYQVPQTQIPLMPQPQTQTGLMPAPAQQQQIVKPTSGKCSVCNQNNLIFFDNGMGKCLFCGRTFDWLNPKRKRLEERQQKPIYSRPMVERMRQGARRRGNQHVARVD